ncbi:MULTISPECIES: DUF6458 family protein [Aestuariimicrobium]|jgi:uncharacterized membrane protein|uniref:DUF6458 family protein n=1 Tax=Aestuariimicrobium TaxID=396388 RepID=UPI0003B6628E|nr:MULTISPECIES: DUF6458 family protein [Aestuariimicrobium]CAI9404290.1 hypothetical protein AESSP_01178 [Aestuariimicrobium sp. T2.26MG-19.2B]
MWIGLGIFLVVVGAILTFAVQVNIPGVSDNTLGWILMIAGVAAIILSFILQAQRQRTRHEVVRDERIDHDLH